METERRRAVRTRPHRVVNVIAGRHDGTLVDLSLRGMRLRHEGPLSRGAGVRVSFTWEKERFAAQGEVLATRVVTLGGNDGEAAIFESRLRFVSMALEDVDALARIMTDMACRELRAWVGNFHGTPEPFLTQPETRVAGFIRCRFIYRRWEKKWTRDAAQPTDGFTLPATTEWNEVDALCRFWEDMNDDARQLVRVTADAVAQQSTYGGFL
jgi:hypothetical protein